MMYILIVYNFCCYENSLKFHPPAAAELANPNVNIILLFDGNVEMFDDEKKTVVSQQNGEQLSSDDSTAKRIRRRGHPRLNL